jgi:hypothetical protein
MNAKKSPDYKTRMALAKTMPRAALLSYCQALGYTAADHGIEAMEDSMLRGIYAAESPPLSVGVTGVTVVHVGAEK